MPLALGPIELAELDEAGLIELRDATALPRCLVRPHDSLITASDLPTRQRRSGARDRPRHRDACTGDPAPAGPAIARPGNGMWRPGALAGASSESVVAVDVNPRALAFTALNAAPNEVHNVECREGSWFTPVAGERFDLIACNPPHVSKRQLVHHVSPRPGHHAEASPDCSVGSPVSRRSLSATMV
jgi:methyltransferase family protein